MFGLKHFLAFLNFLDGFLLLLFDFLSVLASRLLRLLTQHNIVRISVGVPEPLLGRLLLDVPENLDESVVEDSLGAVIGGRGLAGPGECDQRRAWVSLKLDLNVDKSPELAEVSVKMVDGIHLNWYVPHGQHGAALVHVEAPANAPTSAATSTPGPCPAMVKPLRWRLEARVTLVTSLDSERCVAGGWNRHDWGRVGDATGAGDAGDIGIKSGTWGSGLIAQGVLEDHRVIAVIKFAHVAPETESLLVIVPAPRLVCGCVATRRAVLVPGGGPSVPLASLR